MTRPITPVAASVPAELPEPELQEQATTPTVLKRKPPARYKRPLTARIPVDLFRPECGLHRWEMVQHTPRIWQCQVCTREFQGPQR